MSAIGTSRDGDVVTITFTAPERRNPLSSSTLRELHNAFDEAAGSDARAVVLASTGTVWSTGHDLKEMTPLDEDGLRELFTTCTGVMRTIETMPQPVIARCTPWPPPPAASWWHPAIWPWPASRRRSPPRAARGACSATRRWWPSPATSVASAPSSWPCPATPSTPTGGGGDW